MATYQGGALMSCPLFVSQQQTFFASKRFLVMTNIQYISYGMDYGVIIIIIYLLDLEFSVFWLCTFIRNSNVLV